MEVLSEVNEENGQSVHNYVNMIKISDHALQRLIEYFNAQERPIVIVMWGDHAPDVRQFGLEVPNDPMEGIRYYTTPLLIYNNFGLKISDMPQNISAYRLGACVLNALGLERDTYFNYLSSDNVENLTFCAGLLERDGQFFYDGERYNEVAETIKMLHYDRLFGERYGEEL